MKKIKIYPTKKTHQSYQNVFHIVTELSALYQAFLSIKKSLEMNMNGRLNRNKLKQ